MRDPNHTAWRPLEPPPLPGVPVVVLEESPKRQLRVSAHALTAGLTVVRLQGWRAASPKGLHAGGWCPLPRSVRVELWQVEELIAALEQVAEAARNVKRGTP